MRRLVVLVLVALACTTTGCSGNVEFKMFADPGNYRAKMPGTPRQETKSVNGVGIKAYVSDLPGWGFVIECGTLGQGMTLEPDAAIQALANTYQGSVLSSKDITNADGLAGKEVEFQMTKPVAGYASVRFFIHQGRYFQLSALGPSARLTNPNVRTFLESFQLENAPRPGGPPDGKGKF